MRFRLRSLLVMIAVPVIHLALLFSGCSITQAEEFTAAIQAYVKHSLDGPIPNVAMVVGIVDEEGSKLVTYGKIGGANDQEATGDTVFEIGSDTKTFTALLLQDMVERGELSLDDPVARHLPASVKVPTYGGKEMTLRQLARHTSGLPVVPTNLDSKRADNPYADYTTEKLYAFLSEYQLTREPGSKSEYSNAGMGLLGHLLALKAGTSYESLVVERICVPLGMDSTRITLTPELKSRLAIAHNQFGEPVPHWDAPVLAGAGALRSTANDLLKYLSANIALPQSPLTPMMEKTHDDWLVWHDTTDPQGTRIVFHGGGTGGHRSYTGFDKARRRVVVILINAKARIDTEQLGHYLLKCEWRSSNRPMEAKSDAEDYDRYVGRYQRVPSFASRMFAFRQSLSTPLKVALYGFGICGFVMLGVFGWRARSLRQRALLLGGAVLLLGVVLVPLLSSSSQTTVTPAFMHSIDVRREGTRLFAQATGPRSWPIDVILPPGSGELVPEGESRFFEQLSGHRITFSNVRGEAPQLTATYRSDEFVFERISDQPPEPALPIQPRVVIKLDVELLDTFVGDYEFPPSTSFPVGIKAKVWREADQLMWQEQGENTISGAMEIYPESPTTFFTKIDAARIEFHKDANGELTGVSLHLENAPDLMGRKIPSGRH